MIVSLKNCTANELEGQIRYLEGTPVRGIADLLRSGQCILRRGKVQALADLGALKTEFGQLGWVSARISDGQRKFRVAEVVPVLRLNPGADDKLLECIEYFIDREARGEVDYNVTIIKHGPDLIVKDGNKRTIAFYERRHGSSESGIDFPVFIVECGISKGG